jgi:energy-coupling factor transport system substrate-specific component
MTKLPSDQLTDLPIYQSPNLISAATLALASLLGLGAFLYPFFLPSVSRTGMMAHASDAPLLTVLLLVLCLTVIFASLTGREPRAPYGQMTSKLVAVLGVLTAIAAVLRAVPGPAGFNAIFLLPILTGYAYGPTFGFLLGSLSLLVSALIGGGVGPWLPYQMLSTGWVGMMSGWLPKLPRGGRQGSLPRRPGQGTAHLWEPVMLAAWGAVLGLFFGALMNIWFWPFLAGGAQVTQGWQPGMTAWTTLRNYAAFYLATSLWWDLARAGGNALLILLFGGPILRVLRRFRSRFQFQVVPEVITSDAT